MTADDVICHVTTFHRDGQIPSRARQEGQMMSDHLPPISLDRPPRAPLPSSVSEGKAPRSESRRISSEFDSVSKSLHLATGERGHRDCACRRLVVGGVLQSWGVGGGGARGGWGRLGGKADEPLCERWGAARWPRARPRTTENGRFATLTGIFSETGVSRGVSGGD